MEPAVKKLMELRDIVSSPQHVHTRDFINAFCSDLASLLKGERTDFAFEIMDNVRIKFLNALNSGDGEDVCRTLAEIFVRLVALVDTPLEPSSIKFASFLDERDYLRYLKPVLAESVLLALNRE